MRGIQYDPFASSVYNPKQKKSAEFTCSIVALWTSPCTATEAPLVSALSYTIISFIPTRWATDITQLSWGEIIRGTQLKCTYGIGSPMMLFW